jgi:NNP family nitrate/nitrite transporter-like MFS transporter
MSKTDLEKWNVEDERFWEEKGKKIANRNLWISIPSLLVGFAVWLMWGIITVQMKNLGFPFETGELFTLTAIAGLTGATLRIPSSFFIRLAGGRNTIFFTTALLMIPALGSAIALQDKSTPLFIFQVLAFLSGLGGGNFASSMSNISFFYPKKKQGYALGMNAGLGNFGVTTMQILIPLVMTVPLLGFLSGDSMILSSKSGTIFKQIAAGSETWLSNAGWVWMLWLIPLAFLGWFFMNNIKTESVSPDIKNPLVSIARIAWLLLIAFVAAAIGLFFILTFSESSWIKWIVLPVVIALTVFAMKALSPSEIKGNLERQYKIFGNKHTWIMTIIYTMTFGSFIGFAAAVGLSIKFIFGVQHLMVDGVMTHDTANPGGPATFMYVWVGAFIGALIRPVGGWIADKTGGAIVTQIVSIVMVVCSIGVGYFAKLAFQSPTPQDYFMPFFVLLVILFTATGIGNGSTFRTIGVIFNEEQRGPALGWTSAVAAYGAFIIPQVIGEQMAATTPEYAMYGFAVFYIICAGLNWWFYLGPKAEFKNP